MHLIVVGLNHKSASVTLREKLYFQQSSLLDAYKRLSSRPSILGCVILSTCNRIEIYASSAETEQAFEDIEFFIEQFHCISKNDFEQHIYRKHCEDAVSHLFRVVASLDSMVVGEYQIQGQIRDAYTFASEHGFTNNMLNKIFQTATQVGKTIRSETGIGKGSVSIASVAVDLVKRIIHEHKTESILIIGAGKMASIAASSLTELENNTISYCNRTEEKALSLAKNSKANFVHYNDRYSAIAHSDVVIVSTASDNYVITETELAKIISQKKDKHTFFIDISVPRNIDPEIQKLPSVSLYSVDDLHGIISQNIDKRMSEVVKAEQIIADIADDYYQWYAKQEIMPIMMHIKKELDILKTRTFESNKNILSQYSQDQQTEIAQLLDSYSEKLIKAIMKNMQHIASKEDLHRMVQSLQQSFSVDDEL